MSCFSLAWVEHLLIWFVVVIVVVAIVRLVVPWFLSLVSSPPGGSALMTAIGYIVWGVIAIAAIIFAFELLACVFGSPRLLR